MPGMLDSLQFVVFLGAPTPREARELWAETVKSATSFETKAGDTSIAQGVINEFSVAIALSASRCDVQIGLAKAPARGAIRLPDTKSALSRGLAITNALAGILVPSRLAIVGSRTTEVVDDEAATAAIALLVPKLPVKAGTAELTYQCNVPKSSTSLEGSIINRIVTYSAAKRQLVIMTGTIPSVGAPTSVTTETFDVSTDATLRSHIAFEKVGSVLKELSNSLIDLADSGYAVL